LLLVRLLLRGAASGEALIAAVQQELAEEGYPANAPAALKHDLDALRSEYNCRIAYRREQGYYVLEDLGELALLDLSDTALEALVFLDASFPYGSALPEHVGVRELLDRLMRLLPANLQESLGHRRTTLRALPSGAAGRIDGAVLAAVRRAIDERRELSFKYWGPLDGNSPRRHRVAPYGIFFRPGGHGYLDATLLESPPNGFDPLHAALDYRLDRIVPGTVQVLPTSLPPERPRQRTFILRYRLNPATARQRDVTAYFPSTRVEYHDDGGATVTATATNLWQARQVLLRYGDGCQVLEPPELLALFRRTAEGLASIYGLLDSRDDA
jgi:predicted DNA-binding transcriptional regulator YafY